MREDNGYAREWAVAEVRRPITPPRRRWPTEAPGDSCPLDGRRGFGNGRQGGKVRVGLGLIPVGDRIETVRAVVGVPVFHRVLQRLSKRDRIIRMPTVETVTAADSFCIGHQVGAVIEMR